MSPANSPPEGSAQKSREFTITKFERHPDGYLHARVTPAGGRPLYVHRRYGCWFAPGTIKGSAVLKEVTSKDVLYELQRKARQVERAEKEVKPDGDTGQRAEQGNDAGRTDGD